ncbi:hypothetical protein Heshes_06480 [Alicyclobacillus hesperidum]|uniref:Uncharacterized protein n=1 Tax=Alicyclobacillus hesperidum TaxID=89784 RepID=A0AA37U626_9BACL|nr:hypothetical protein Heshes_06480 [Alicyclobacillus hesperidum]
MLRQPPPRQLHRFAAAVQALLDDAPACKDSQVHATFYSPISDVLLSSPHIPPFTDMKDKRRGP